ncbi:hypothetical protein [Paraburkholderia sp. BCC1876]|uniref:hypothetical protein n=1 Tax=Paraburkholderia sp. BCC1876 TaxID=2676303 RepID=UPI00159013F4|nr:hypothetical protein [Paraburkholderia sp. BCC1876]
MRLRRKLRFAAATLVILSVLGFATSPIAIAANGPVLYINVSFTPIFAQRYGLSYYKDSNWSSLANSGGTVQLNPRFSFEKPIPEKSIYKYAISLADKNNSNIDLYLFISTSKKPCIVQKTTASQLNDSTLGFYYDVVAQYVNLSIERNFNSNVSVSYSVCSRENSLSLRFFDPIAGGIPIGIGSYVMGEPDERVSETYIIFNTEGILYP